jgi:hypothetical protein
MSIVCSNCKENNPDGTKGCANCGAIITPSAPKEVLTIPPIQIPEPPPPLVLPVQRELPMEPPEDKQSELITEDRQSAPITENRQSDSTIAGNARLVVIRGVKVKTSFELNSAINNEIGRSDNKEGKSYFPNIDLDKHDLERYVHRQHATIKYEGGHWQLIHKGESNSTRVRRGNKEEKLKPNQPFLLQSGDELIVGRVYLRFEVL